MVTDRRTGARWPLVFGYEAWWVPGMTTTGHDAWCTTWLLTEPMS